MSTKTSFSASDGKQIYYYTWIPRGAIRGVVQIVHGMAEHAARYDHFAVKLRTQGFAVYACDLRGHGSTIEEPAETGYFGPEDGWSRVSEDLFEFTEIIRSANPDRPLFLFGHSMGSFLARTLMITHGSSYDGVILSGTASSPGFMGTVGKFIAQLAVKKDGGKVPNKMLNTLSFGSYNKSFKPNRTEFDWLSRDEKQVDAYVKDPLCGFIATSKFYEDLLSGLLYVNDNENMVKIPKELPVMLLSGAKDPVGKMGVGVRQVFEQLKAVGVSDIEINLIPDARHETLNETNRNEVEKLCLDWMISHR